LIQHIGTTGHLQFLSPRAILLEGVQQMTEYFHVSSISVPDLLMNNVLMNNFQQALFTCMSFLMRNHCPFLAFNITLPSVVLLKPTYINEKCAPLYI
jgi:hypothetical protein